MTPLLRAWFLPVTLITFVCGVAFGQGEAAEERFSFERRVIDGAFSNGYQVSVADIDSDGRKDIIALSTTPSRLVWYRNPDWTRFVIASETERNIDVAPYDVDGDGDMDLALASKFSLGNSRAGGDVHWLACPDDPTANEAWSMYLIDTVPTSHRVRWADLDGDGQAELLNLPIIGVGAEAPEYGHPVEFKAYTIPEDPRRDTWDTQVIDSSLEVAHGLAVLPWDGDEPAEILTASFGGIHLFELAEAGQFSRTRLGAGDRGARPKQGSSEVVAGTLGDSNQRFIAAIEPWHGHQVVVYRPEHTEGLWTRQTIDDHFNDGHALGCADLDGDGSDEIVAGFRGKPYGLYIYVYNTETREWDRVVLDEGGCAAAGIYLADLDNDGDTDVVATGTGTGNVILYENAGR